jgi:hypothetical protein
VRVEHVGIAPIGGLHPGWALKVDGIIPRSSKRCRDSRLGRRRARAGSRAARPASSARAAIRGRQGKGSAACLKVTSRTQATNPSIASVPPRGNRQR